MPAFRHFLTLPTSWSIVVVTEISHADLLFAPLQHQINALLAARNLLFDHTAESKRFRCLLDALLLGLVLFASDWLDSLAFMIFQTDFNSNPVA